LLNNGWDIAQRSAGSHSPIDVFAINKKEGKILFIQSKPNNFPESQRKKITSEMNFLNKFWDVEFVLI